MVGLLDAMSELVYVVNIDTYELLYMNASGKEKFGIQTLDGKKCYEIIQGRDAPCEFCTTPFLKEEDYYTWESTNPVIGRHYLLKDKLIPWEGRMARIEIAFDLTEKQQVLEAEALLVDCMEVLQKDRSFSETVEIVLQRLARFYHAPYVGALMTQGALIRKAYEWREEGEPSYAKRLKDISVNSPAWEAIWGNGRQMEFAPEIICKSTAAGGPEWLIHLFTIGPSSVLNTSLPMVLKTLANFMTSVLQAEQYRVKLEKWSFVDALTGALNRNAFTKEMDEAALPVAKPAGVVYVSVNGIKALNDRNGRSYGDQVLINTVNKLRALLNEAKIYRISGDEFLAIWIGVSGTTFDNRIRKVKEWQERELSAKFALGYQWVDRCGELSIMVEQAEERMYEDKKRYYREMAQPKRYRPSSDQVLPFGDPGTLEQMLRDQRFPVYFQPKFSVFGHELLGAEALVRFVTDSGQFLPPNQFIPFLEGVRLIEKVDYFVFRYVCAKISEWLKAGKQVAPISVNFSRYTIDEPWFHDTLLDIWNEHCVPKRYVEIEITESAEENCGKDLLKILTQLQHDGFPVSIDDFGVKYANLSIFTNGSFSTLKVDRSLISDWKNPRTEEILKVLCEVCKRTGVRMVAEGVEQEEQLEFLERIRCEGVQGFLFSRPLPLREYERRYVPESVSCLLTDSRLT